MPDTYDYIVVGAGSAGCVVAARLSETICRGEFALHGFRNRDLCERLLADETTLTARQVACPPLNLW